MSAAVAAAAHAGATCIRCGDCADACPAGLQPQLLLLHLRAGRDARALAAGLDACNECGRCAAACPPAIPLPALFADAKAAARGRALALARADAARDRYLARGVRLQRLADEREQQQATRAASASSVDAVAAALARARARRGGDGG